MAKPDTVLRTPDSWGASFFLAESDKDKTIAEVRFTGGDFALASVADLTEYSLRSDGRYEAGIDWTDGFRFQVVHIVDLDENLNLVTEQVEKRRHSPAGMVAV